MGTEATWRRWRRGCRTRTRTSATSGACRRLGGRRPPGHSTGTARLGRDRECGCPRAWSSGAAAPGARPKPRHGCTRTFHPGTARRASPPPSAPCGGRRSGPIPGTRPRTCAGRGACGRPGTSMRVRTLPAPRSWTPPSPAHESWRSVPPSPKRGARPPRAWLPWLEGSTPTTRAGSAPGTAGTSARRLTRAAVPRASRRRRRLTRPARSSPVCRGSGHGDSTPLEREEAHGKSPQDRPWVAAAVALVIGVPSAAAFAAAQPAAARAAGAAHVAPATTVTPMIGQPGGCPGGDFCRGCSALPEVHDARHDSERARHASA